MNVVYRFRIYPNKIQQELFAKTFGCVRFVYNRMLAEKKECYEKTGKNLKVTPAKYKAEFPWLKEVDSLALCNAQLHLQTAYKNFFRDPSFGFPKFKSKKNPVKSYTTNSVNGNILLKEGKLKLPKTGWIRIRQHRKIREDACLKGASVCMEADGRYYVSLLYFCEEKPVETRNIRQAVGLDFSMKELYVDSNGKHAGYPHYFRNSEEKLAKAQRKLSHCRKGSNRYKKQQKKVARIHTHIAHQRKDYLHKESRKITNFYDIVCIEDL
ncbi:transposase, partial [Clostridium sp. AM45-5]